MFGMPAEPVSAAIALNRFGLGARAGETPPADPKAWLRAQQHHFDPRPTVIAATPHSSALAAAWHEYSTQVRAASMKAKRAANAGLAPSTAPAAVMPVAFAKPATPGKPLQHDVRHFNRDSYEAQERARLLAALTTPAPFAERLTYFWANHFAVSADNVVMLGLAGTLEFEAIRPNVFGRFGDLLQAVETHPAMLSYLDQIQSIGPDSAVQRRASLRQARTKSVGLNENLAREILELHTLGVGSGYSQADVQELARALTGWSVGGFLPPTTAIAAVDGGFVFQPDWHQPGERVLLGKTYRQDGDAQGRAMLADLAVHPATAHHLATKLARHFAGDVPPPALVERLAATHMKTGGDLSRVYETLIDAPEIWSRSLAKFKTPWEWLVSALRGVGVTDAPDLKFVVELRDLGQSIWKPRSPAGWDDTAPSWAAPDALLRRVEVAQRLAATIGDRLDARMLARRLLPGTLRPETSAAIARAASPAQALALLLVAPEFMRR